MKARRIVPLFTLIFLVFQSMTSCSDTDIASCDGGDGSADTEEADARSEKYEVLSSLLGMVADVDSLPDNWERSDYYVHPTIGEAENEASPYGVRLVATTSTAEADRIYRSLVSKSVTGEVPTSDTWQMDGIGSLSFEPKSEANLYATLKVKVGQLRELEEIRFVPASAIGSNLAPKDIPFYQVGDVILQEKAGEKPTYWVCVRPCSKLASKRRSHWCTLQLNPYDAPNANYAWLTKSNKGDIYVPTNLCKSKADGERMVQDYFNLLRLMLRPELYQNPTVTGLGEIEKGPELSVDSLNAISYMWNEYGIMDKLGSEELMSGLKSTLKRDEAYIGALYHGYSKHYVGRGDYRVYNLGLSVNAKNDDDVYLTNCTLFNQADKNTYWGQFGTKSLNFKDFEKSGSSSDINLYDGTERVSGNLYLVKYKTGAQLEENLIMDTDNTPGQSFQRANNRYRITDVFESKDSVMKRATMEDAYSLPFFAFGDEVTPKNELRSQRFLCVKQATQTIEDGDKGKAVFIEIPAKNTSSDYEDSESDETKIFSDYREPLTDKMALYVSYQMLNAVLKYEIKSFPYELRNEIYMLEYKELLSQFFLAFDIEDGPFSFKKFKVNGDEVYELTTHYYKAGDEQNHLSYHRVHLFLNTADKSIKYYFDNTTLLGIRNILSLSYYDDKYVYFENFSHLNRELRTEKESRKYLKQNLNGLWDKFLENAVETTQEKAKIEYKEDQVQGEDAE